MTTKHRKCGCDCNDQTRWVEDDGITQATFDCGCEDGAKPPCVYYANFECQVTFTGDRADVFPDRLRFRQYVRGVPAYLEQLRPICKWSPLGQYVSLRQVDPPTLFGSAINAIDNAVTNGSCTWDDILLLGDVPYRTQPSNWDSLAAETRWTLSIVNSPVTMVHYGGATYVQNTDEIWDCFGPNTLWLDKDPAEYGDYSTLPTFVCITPSVFAAKNEPASCDQCYSMTIPKILFYYGEILEQKVQFLRALIEDGSRTAGPIIDDATARLMQAPILLQRTLYGSAIVNDVENQFDGRRAFITMQFVDEIDDDSPSRVTITFPFNGNAGGGTYLIERFESPLTYSCNQFQCGQTNVFALDPFIGVGSSAGWPATLTLEPGDCTRSNQYQWGPCWNVVGSTSWEDGYPRGSTEESRRNCCDPWCSCAPGWLKVFNPIGANLTQSFGGITSTPANAFCEGGRYGLDSPNSVSREWCLPTVYAADGTAHEVCMVLYCGSLGGGVTWLIDWYCDGTFVATRNMNQVMNCCPNQMAQLGPAMPCLPGAVLCVGINVEPACEPPPPCCNLSDYGSTLTLSMYTTGCSGWPATISLTKSGSQFTGSFVVTGNTISVLFDAVNPVNGVDCGIKFTCSATGSNQTSTMTSASCSPPTLTGTVNLGLTFGCGCGVFATVLCILNSP